MDVHILITFFYNNEFCVQAKQFQDSTICTILVYHESIQSAAQHTDSYENHACVSKYISKKIKVLTNKNGQEIIVQINHTYCTFITCNWKIQSFTHLTIIINILQSHLPSFAHDTFLVITNNFPCKRCTSQCL